MEIETKTEVQPQTGRAARLEKLGFKTAGIELKGLLQKQKNLAIAYEHYRYVTPERVNEFNQKLLNKTGKNLHSMLTMEYQTLAFTPIECYAKVPPDDVLASLEVAQDRKCFDAFEVAYIKNVKDPLLFGRVNGTPNRFFIAQWDNDVTIDQLLKENEG